MQYVEINMWDESRVSIKGDRSRWLLLNATDALQRHNEQPKVSKGNKKPGTKAKGHLGLYKKKFSFQNQVPCKDLIVIVTEFQRLLSGQPQQV